MDSSSYQPDNRRGTGFTNLQKVLDANDNNQLGSTVAQGVSNTADQAKGALNQDFNQFQTQADQNNLNTDQNTQTRKSILDNPTAAAQDDSNTPKFQSYLAGQYNGPKGLSSYQQDEGGLQDAENLGNLTGSYGGRQALLQRFVGGPSYTQGQQTLDNFLLSGQGNLNQVRQQTTGLGNLGNQTSQNAANIANQYQAGNKQFGVDTRSQLGVDDSGNQLSTGVYGNLNSAIDQNYNTLAQQEAQNKNAYQSQLDAYQNQGKAINDLGINYDYGGNILANSNASDAVGLTRDTGATADQKATEAALAKLTGGTFNDPGNYTAGQYNINNGAIQQGFNDNYNKTMNGQNGDWRQIFKNNNAVSANPFGAYYGNPNDTLAQELNYAKQRMALSPNDQYNDYSQVKAQYDALNQLAGKIKGAYGAPKVF